MKNPRVLFILKLRHIYSNYNAELKSSGLLNSALFVKDMLDKNGYETKLAQVVDANSIDREVHQYRPDIVILEALWVPPAKFHILQKLHPNVKWVVRVHSEIPFLAHEGIAINYLSEYIKHKNVYISFNSKETQRDFEHYFHHSSKLIYLPNYYPVRHRKIHTHKHMAKRILNVACFGAIRPLKNTMSQAFAAVEFAELNGYQCYFHINVDRVEGNAEPILKNLRHFFGELCGKHILVEHKWMDHSEFLELISTMDICLQVSMSETFNICTADAIEQGVPVVVSNQIPWVPELFHADPTDVSSIVHAMKRALLFDVWFHWLHWSRRKLMSYSNRSKKIWIENLTRLFC